MQSLIMYGQPVVDLLKQQILKDVELLGRVPCLVAVGFEDNLQWQQYATSLEKSSATYNCHVECLNVASNSSIDDFNCLIQQLSQNSAVDGILIQQPLPAEFADAVNSLAFEKDIDGLSSHSMNSIYLGREKFLPATPLAVLKLLEFYDITLLGKNIAVLGRGVAVGKPLSLMLLNRNATPTICHTKTRDIAKICQRADIIVSACGKANLVTADFVNSNSVVVDVGLSFENNKTCGDVDFDSVVSIAKAVSPVPRGIGPVTRACLFSNLVKAAFLKDGITNN